LILQIAFALTGRKSQHLFNLGTVCILDKYLATVLNSMVVAAIV
jgi:hypothetical protein